SKIQNPKSKIRNLQEKNLIIMHPGAGSPRKRWPVENFVQVATIIRKMNLGEVVFVVGPAESDLAPFIKARPKGGFRVYEVCDLSHVMVLVQQARCFLGNDSGVTHLAAFMGTPTVAIFGPSSPKRWAPVGRATKVLRGAADCAPCFEMDGVNCKDPQCLSGVSVDMVLDAVREITLVSRSRGSGHRAPRLPQ
ncbi:MAG: glycosyltransferase family 9 protein, partial [Desulfobacterales bacterium]|nr:glycosyltransferase family 9 protein [Desulfobacterales bacterium]